MHHTKQTTLVGPLRELVGLGIAFVLCISVSSATGAGIDQATPQITITNIASGYLPSGSCSQNLSHIVTVNWHTMGGAPPEVVHLFSTVNGQTHEFGPFPWPEEDNFTFLMALPEGGSLEIKAQVKDAKQALSTASKRITLNPCPPFLGIMKPPIHLTYDLDDLVPEGGTMLVPATLINNIEKVSVTAIAATGCTVRSVQPTLPLTLLPQESKAVSISLRCPEGGGSAKLRLLFVAGFQSHRLGIIQFDVNGNDTIDDPEIFHAIDQWVAGQINDELLFAVLDAWVAQTPVSSTNVSSSKPITLATHSANGFLTFLARDEGIISMVVEIFNLSGQLVFSQDAMGTRLTWNLRTHDGKPLASGVYLYLVIARSSDGKLIRSEVKKLVILR